MSISGFLPRDRERGAPGVSPLRGKDAREAVVVRGVGEKFDAGKTGRATAALPGAPAVPDVGGKVVVVAAGTVEGGTGVMGHDVEAERAGLEVLGRRQIAHLKVDMSNDGPVGRARPGARGIGGKRAEVERIGRHPDPAIAAPRLAPRTSARDLDAGTLGVCEEDSLD